MRQAGTGGSSGHVVTTLRDHHATIFVPSGAAGPIEAVRRTWDPGMAAQIAPHVTLAYPQEASDAGLLTARLRAASLVSAPFRLRLGRISCFGRPEDGVYVEIGDVDGEYGRLREELLRPPFRPVAFPPHVTLVHPRTSPRGREFWEEGGDRHRWRDLQFTVEEVAVTAFDGTRWIVLEKFALGRGKSAGARVLVGAILTRGSSILLGRRASTLRFYPGVWDVLGGHVEPHETPERALVRELREELGITLTRFEKLAMLHDVGSGQQDGYEYHLYHVTRWTGTPRNLAPEEHDEVRWAPLEEALRLELALPAYRPIFERVAADATS